MASPNASPAALQARFEEGLRRAGCLHHATVEFEEHPETNSIGARVVTLWVEAEFPYDAEPVSLWGLGVDTAKAAYKQGAR